MLPWKQKTGGLTREEKEMPLFEVAGAMIYATPREKEMLCCAWGVSLLALSLVPFMLGADLIFYILIPLTGLGLIVLGVLSRITGAIFP